MISTQALAVERPVLELPNVPRAVSILINAFSFHAAGLGGALVGGEGVHECCLLPGGPASGLVVLQVAAVVWFCPASRFYACWGCLADLGERDEVSSSANPGALDGQLWQLSGQRAGPAAHAWRRVEQL